MLLLQSQTDRCESVIKYDSITDRQLPRRTVLWLVTIPVVYWTWKIQFIRFIHLRQ